MAVLQPLRETTPRRIGPYDLLARLGSGGMGEVHLARGPEGTVALKTVRAALAGEPGFRARFRREIAVARSVDSPYVARLTGGDADADPPWLATEYVPGPTLAEAVRLAGPLPPATVRALGAHLVRALHAVHAAPALHRDLKPGNVLLGADGPRLIDFGVARAPDATTLTGTGLMVGTPGFMSPEHLAGGRHVVAASDVFCLASVLCYAATGEDPFGDGPLAAVLHRVSQAKTDLSAVPAPLRDVLADCLHVDPAARPGTETLMERFGAPHTGAFGWPAPVRERIARGRSEADSAAQGSPVTTFRCDDGQPAGDGSAPPGGVVGAERRGGGLGVAGPGPAGSGADGAAGSAVPGASAAAFLRRDGDQLATAFSAVPGLPEGGSAPPVAVVGAERHGGGLGVAGPGGPVPGVSAYVHELPTMGAPQPASSPAPSRGRSPLTLGLAAFAALVVGAAGVFGVHQLTRPGGDDRPADAAAAKDKPAQGGGPDGVDEAGGPDGAGSLPGRATARPAGWHAWSGRLSKGPLGCAADGIALVCQLLDGSYEAVGAKDGKQLWRYDPVEGPEAGTSASISPTGLVIVPGGGLPPAVRAGTAVVAAGGRIQARDAASGKVHWEKRFDAEPGTMSFKGKPLVVGGRAFVGVSTTGQGYDLLAYDLSDGRELWRKRLASARLARAFQQDFSPVAAKDGVVYARSERDVSAYDAATGAERGETEPVGRGCEEILVQGGSVLCGEHTSDRDGGRLTLHRFDAWSLAAGEDVPLADATARRDLRITSADDKVVVGVDHRASRVVVVDRTGRTPELVRTVPKSDAPFPRTLASAPLIVGDRLLFATNTALVRAPLDAGQGRTTPVEGAPGDRPEPDYDKKNGVDLTKSVRPPVALPAGGVVHIVYDQGVVRSVELPH
ncbi:protein kinase domain-containing protein [Streptomyces roseifaciens]|uniref:serine/threonine-protein kinase n=1 Tax=Streptomyces roseifaciens TaxID=1488406 RepID=UPI000718297B|nr:serine/threonine-protein kinase [Streptomyces roseifaciens]